MGHDYDAAVICSGVCGFGMGATPNALANMQALCEKYAPSVKAVSYTHLVGAKPFCFNASHYTQEELTEKAHNYELPAVRLMPAPSSWT